MWPAPKVEVPTPQVSAAAVKAAAEPPPPPNYFRETLTTSFMYTSGLGGILGKA